MSMVYPLTKGIFRRIPLMRRRCLWHPLKFNPFQGLTEPPVTDTPGLIVLDPFAGIRRASTAGFINYNHSFEQF